MPPFLLLALVALATPHPPHGAADVAPLPGLLARHWCGTEAVPQPEDLVIGDVPGETLVIRGPWSRTGNVFVVNDGLLRLVDADFELDGSVHVSNRGRFEADSSRIRFVQHNIYDHVVSAAESALVCWRDCSTDYNGYVFSFFAGNWARFELRRVENRDFTTAVVMHDARVDLEDVNLTGEWLFDGSTRGRFSRCDYLLTWYFFPDGADAALRFPDGDFVDGFVLDSTVPGVRGIGYRVAVDSSTDVMWAALPRAGSRVTVDSSDLRVVGIVMAGGDSFALSGLVNGQQWPDYTLPLADRTFRVRATRVNTWNLYAFDSCSVELRSSIFGELCAYGSNRVEIRNSLCDGTGGHLESSGTAFLLVAFSTASCDVITRGRSVTVLAQVSQPIGRLWATEASGLALVNCQLNNPAVASDTAFAIAAAVTGPDEAVPGDSVPVRGTAWMASGPHLPIGFDRYRLAWRPRGDSTWQRLGQDHDTTVFSGVLDYWDTRALAPGVYEVMVSVLHTGSDSITAAREIRLLPAAAAELAPGREPDQVLSTIVRGVLHMGSQLSASSLQRAELLDISGTRMMELRAGDNDVRGLAPGVYFVMEQDSRGQVLQGSSVRKVAVAR